MIETIVKQITFSTKYLAVVPFRRAHVVLSHGMPKKRATFGGEIGELYENREFTELFLSKLELEYTFIIYSFSFSFSKFKTNI